MNCPLPGVLIDAARIPGRAYTDPDLASGDPVFGPDGRLASAMRTQPAHGSVFTINLLSVGNGQVLGRAAVETRGVSPRFG
jgi:hypothetical protein